MKTTSTYCEFCHLRFGTMEVGVLHYGIRYHAACWTAREKKRLEISPVIIPKRRSFFEELRLWLERTLGH